MRTPFMTRTHCDSYISRYAYTFHDTYKQDTYTHNLNEHMHVRRCILTIRPLESQSYSLQAAAAHIVYIRHGTSHL